jgi:very-short-patch-repair endonuclease
MDILSLVPLAVPTLVLAAVLTILLVRARRRGLDDSKASKKRGEPSEWPYALRPVLTEREQVLFHRLRKALPEYIVLAQVQLSQVITVKSRVESRQAWLNKIAQKSVDFVVCSHDLSVVAVIELDDGSHDTQAQAKRDRDKDKALKHAGVRIVRTREIPSVESIRKTFGQRVDASEAAANSELGPSAIDGLDIGHSTVFPSVLEEDHGRP